MITCLFVTTSTSVIIDVILGVLAIVIGIYAILTTTKIDIMENAIRLIKDAQLFIELAGSDKMKWVVDNLADQIPKIFHAIFTKEILEEIAQNMYDKMKEYRDNWVESTAKKEDK